MYVFILLFSVQFEQLYWLYRDTIYKILGLRATIIEICFDVERDEVVKTNDFWVSPNC